MQILGLALKSNFFFLENDGYTPKPKKILDTQMNPSFIPPEEKHGSYWRKSALTAVKSKLEEPKNVNKAKNGILFIGKFNFLYEK